MCSGEAFRRRALRTAAPAVVLVAGLVSAACVGKSGRPAIPFAFVKNQIVVEVRVNGAGPYSFLLDTGVTPSVIDRSIVTAAGVAIDSTRGGEASGAGSGVLRVHPVSLARVEAGGVVSTDLEALATDLSKLGARLGQPLRGILGENVFAGKVVTIDYAARRVAISTEAPAAAGGIEIPFTTAPDDVIPIIQDFEVRGRKIPVSLDTGSSLALELYPAAVESLGLQELKEAGERGEITGARGEAGVIKARLDGARLAGLPVDSVEVTFSERTDHGPERLGNVGNALLRHFTVTFDYPRRSVRFEPAE